MADNVEIKDALQLAESAIEAWDHVLAGKPERELVEVLKGVRDALASKQEELADMTNDRDLWRDNSAEL